jgi:hypothetical protein
MQVGKAASTSISFALIKLEYCQELHALSAMMALLPFILTNQAHLQVLVVFANIQAGSTYRV